MSTKAEKKAVAELLEQLDTLDAWLTDTAYPAKDRRPLENAIQGVRVLFGMMTDGAVLGNLPINTDVRFIDRTTGIWHNGWIGGVGITEANRPAYLVYRITGETAYIDRDDVRPL